MCDEWLSGLKLPLTAAQFQQLPRNPAFKYEYLNGRAYLTPRPRHYHAVLELKPTPSAPPEGAGAGIEIRCVTAADFPALEVLFTAAFHRVQPFSGLDDKILAEAAHQCLAKARTGGDGVWVEQASFVAFTRDQEHAVGAILITLLPDGDPCDGNSYYWIEPPPADLLERGLGRAHLTWVFVSPLHSGQGIGTALLAAAANKLHALGYHQLLSTFLLGNDLSMLWHWRNGFQVLPYPYSFRARRTVSPRAGGERAGPRSPEARG
jgi:ribosomal protein S18 acetylase RimI-like enzyme